MMSKRVSPELLLLLACCCVWNCSYAVPFKNSLRIYGGEKVNITEVPYMAIYRTIDNSAPWPCGAVIVAEQFLLSAAHCTSMKKNNMKITVGTDNTDQGEDYEIETVYGHESYDFKSADYDICVIKLKKKLTLNNKIQPIIMADTNQELKSGDLMDLIGFGSTQETNLFSKQLLKVRVPYMDFDQCSQKYKLSNLHLTERMICAGGESGKGMYTGDGGGPLVYNNLLVGIVSWGPHPPGLEGYPDVYASIMSMRVDFIDRKIDSGGPVDDIDKQIQTKVENEINDKLTEKFMKLINDNRGGIRLDYPNKDEKEIKNHILKGFLDEVKKISEMIINSEETHDKEGGMPNIEEDVKEMIKKGILKNIPQDVMGVINKIHNEIKNNGQTKDKGIQKKILTEIVKKIQEGVEKEIGKDINDSEANVQKKIKDLIQKADEDQKQIPDEARNNIVTTVMTGIDNILKIEFENIILSDIVKIDSTANKEPSRTRYVKAIKKEILKEIRREVEQSFSITGDLDTTENLKEYEKEIRKHVQNKFRNLNEEEKRSINEVRTSIENINKEMATIKKTIENEMIVGNENDKLKNDIEKGIIEEIILKKIQEGVEKEIDKDINDSEANVQKKIKDLIQKADEDQKQIPDEARNNIVTTVMMGIDNILKIEFENIILSDIVKIDSTANKEPSRTRYVKAIKKEILKEIRREVEQSFSITGDLETTENLKEYEKEIRKHVQNKFRNLNEEEKRSINEVRTSIENINKEMATIKKTIENEMIVGNENDKLKNDIEKGIIEEIILKKIQEGVEKEIDNPSSNQE